MVVSQRIEVLGSRVIPSGILWGRKGGLSRLQWVLLLCSICLSLLLSPFAFFCHHLKVLNYSLCSFDVDSSAQASLSGRRWCRTPLSLNYFLILILLEYSWFTMLYLFQVYSKVLQLYIYIYSFFFRFFSHIGYHRILSRIPCAIQ